MGTSLINTKPQDTYPGLIKTTDNAAISATLKTLSDGNGNDFPMEISTTAVNFTGTLTQNGSPVTTPPSGVSGAIQFSDGSAFASDAANLFWDDTNNRLGVGTNAPSATGHFKGSGSTSATTSLLVQNSSGTNTFKVQDDGSVLFGLPSTIFTAFQLTSSVGRLQININDNSTYGTIIRSFNAAGSDNQKLSFWASGFNFETNGGLHVSNNATGAVASAILQADSTTKGFLPPRMTTTQKNAISSPAAGLVVYDSTTNKLCCYNGSSWNDLF
jgi:hypothetical protein